MITTACLLLPAPIKTPDVAAVLRQALLNDLNQHTFDAQMAHDWAVKQVTGATSVLGTSADYSMVDCSRFRSEQDVSNLLDDVHRMMAMYPAALTLDGIFSVRGHVSRGGQPYLVVNDHFCDVESVRSLMPDDFRVEQRPSCAFPVITLAWSY